ncbi:hypothetical protein PLICRDRAFT_28101 [Plicaturopsis crispa FD-325 SS-3]|nr:hypothetical protein PLICRDRAFT_28101 [Plicaturopsis crispa FD-325 SS-3]
MVASEDDKPKIAAAMRRAYERSNRCSRDDDGTLRLPKAHLSSVLLDLDASFRKKVLLRIEDDALVSVDDLLRHLEDTSKPVAVDKTLLAPGGSSTFTHPSTASSQIGTISTDEHLSEDEPRGGSFSTISNPLDVRDNSTLDTLARPNDLTGSERIWNHFDGYFATCFNKLDEFSREFEALRRSHESIEKNNAARDSSQRQAEDELLSLKTTQTEHEVVTSSRYKKLSQDLKTIQADVGNAIAEGMRFAKSLRAHQRTVETGLEIVKGQQKTAHRDVQALEDDLASMRDAFFVHETGASAKMFEEIARLTAKVHEIEQGVEKLAGSFEDRGAWPAQMDNDLPAAGNCITAGGEHVVHKTLASELSREFVDEFGSESSRIVELSESADIEGLKQLGIEEWRHIGIETSFSEELSDFENGRIYAKITASERGSCHKDALSPKVATTAGMVEIPAKNNAIDAVPGSEFLGGLEGFEDGLDATAAVARTESGYEYGSASRMTLGNDPNVGDKIVSKSSRIADVAAGEDIESPCDHGFPTSTVDEIPGRELAPEVASGEGTTYTKTKAAFPLGIPPAETTRESPKYRKAYCTV